MLNFQHKEYLIALAALLPLALLFFMVLRWKKKVTRNLGDERLVLQLTKDYAPHLYKWKFILVLAALVLGILSSANLRKPKPGSNEKRAGIDVMIALDVSKSMLSQDVKPSRLEKARQCLNLLISNLQDDRIGFVVFAGNAYLQMPLTSDIAASRLFVANASPDAVPMQGTAVGEALRLCNRSLDTKERKYKAVVLISDGEDHDPKSVDAIKELTDQGVIVNTIGVGTAQGAPIMEPGSGAYKTDANGQTVITRLNEQELKDIAQKTGGIYSHLDDAQQTVASVTSALGNMDKKAFEAGNGTRQYASFFPFFIAMAILLLVIEVFVPETKRQKS